MGNDAYIIQQRADGKWVAQHCNWDAREYPNPEMVPASYQFTSLESVIAFYRDAAAETEYGFKIFRKVDDQNLMFSVDSKVVFAAAAKEKVDQARRQEFEQALARVVNQYSMENASTTPDFLIGAYLAQCLDTYNETVQKRDEWLGK